MSVNAICTEMEAPLGRAKRNLARGELHGVTQLRQGTRPDSLKNRRKTVQEFTMSRSIAYSSRNESRLNLGQAAIFSVAQAVGLLPLADREAKQWLIDHDLIRHLSGRRVVIWGEVLHALSSNEDDAASEPQTTRNRQLPLRRANLGDRE